MTQSLFGAPQGGSFADNLRRALDFTNANLRRSPAPADAATIDAEPLAALADDVAPEAAAPAAAEVATELAPPVAVADEGADLAAAIRAAAAEQPAAAIVEQGAEAAVAAPARQAPAWRGWGIQDLADRLGGGGRIGAGAPAPEAVADVAAAAVDAAPPQKLGDRLVEALRAARHPAAPAAPAAEAAAEAVEHAAKPSLLETLRAGMPDMAALRGSAGAGGAVADVALEGAEQATRSLKDDLLKGLLQAGEIATKAR
jgi:hypothetical protein